jgi:hypothetical protein
MNQVSRKNMCISIEIVSIQNWTFFVLKNTNKHETEILYVQVTVHRDNLRINNQQDASNIQNFILPRNSTYFGHLLCPSSGVISCARGNWYVSCRLCGRCSGHITCMPSSSSACPTHLTTATYISQ